MYYYEAFAEELKKLGNEVLLLNTAFFNSYESNIVENKRLDDMILSKTKRFDPQLIITFNHRIPKSILDSIDVPTIIWDGDSPLYLCDHEYIKKNIDRYKIFSISKEWYGDYMDMGFKDSQFAFMPNATSVIKKDMTQDMKITYLGTRIWTNQTVPAAMARHMYLPQAKKIVMENLTQGKAESGYYLEKYFKQQQELNGWDERYVYPLLEKRWLTLANVLDMGLTVCGSYSRWESVYEMMPQLLAMYDPRRVWTLQENIDFYNSSMISLSPIHPQANGKAFPWRAFDVMASNACLVIEKSSGFCDLIKGEVDIPVFSSPYEVRDICKELLNDEERRKEIVAQSQKWVEKHARWKDRFKDTQDIVGVKLMNDSQEGFVDELVNEVGAIKCENKGKMHYIKRVQDTVIMDNEHDKAHPSAISSFRGKIRVSFKAYNLLNIVSALLVCCFVVGIFFLGRNTNVCQFISKDSSELIIGIGLGINILLILLFGIRCLKKGMGYVAKKMVKERAEKK